VVFAIVMGVLGGFFPARRAANLPVIQALRA
jgi:ABC-type antimicrobial peptide transport system permease subunit